jgi:hypothetical protein
MTVLTPSWKLSAVSFQLSANPWRKAQAESPDGPLAKGFKLIADR